MGTIVGLITWPLRTSVAVITHLLRLCFSIVLFPYRITCTLIRSLQEKANNTVHFVEEKIGLLKRRKPVCYFFPSCQAVVNKQDTILQSETDSGPTSGAEEDESQSIASLIQDLIKLSQPETRQQFPDSRQTQQEKIQLLLQELTEMAESSGVSSQREGGLEEPQEGEGVSVMLKDLSVLEGYLSQFLEEQEHHSNGPLLPDRTSSLETIIEETTSKESSPYHPGSPLPPSHRMKPLVPVESTIDEEDKDLTESQNEISQTLLMLQKVTNSKELKETLQQLAEMHKQQTEFQTPPSSLSSTPDPGSSRHSPPSDKERHQALTTQLTDSQNQMDSIIDSLVQQQKVMTCQQELLSSQQELQNVMDSLTLQSSTPPKTTQSTTPTQDQLYDSLASINATPTYAKINKPPRPLNTTPTTQEDIYDSIQPLSHSLGGDEAPPPVPRRRAGSDASTDSCDNSPKLHVKKKRHHSSEEERSKHRRSVRKHSSFSHRHHKRHSDHSLDDRHHHSTSDDSQDESDYTSGGRRGRYESSGYDSHQDFDSPVVTRRRGRRHSDVNLGVEPLMTPPSTGKRSFFGFFGKKSTSLTSLSSNKSGDASERASISSYKM